MNNFDAGDAEAVIAAFQMRLFPDGQQQVAFEAMTRRLEGEQHLDLRCIDGAENFQTRAALFKVFPIVEHRKLEWKVSPIAFICGTLCDHGSGA